MTQNTVEILVKSSDGTKQGFDSAAQGASRLKESLKGVGQTAAGVLTAELVQKGAEKFKEFVSSSVEAASNLGESVNAVQQIFGSSSTEIQKWGKENAESFGLSQRAFNELATPLGAGLKNAGLSLQDTSKWTIDLTKRASDMASVFNTSVPDALEAIQAGLRGESDPLERYGVGLSAAKVQAEALAETGKKSANSLTGQELATARLNIIMKQTAATAGDFQRTSNGLANSERITSAQWEDAKAKLGQGLLPVMTKAAQVSGALASAFAALPGPMQSVVVVGGAAAVMAAVLAPRIAKVKEQLHELGSGALAADTRLGGMARAVGRVSAVLAAVNVASAAFGEQAGAGVNTATKALEQYAQTGKMSADVTKDLSYTLGTLDDSGPAKVSKGIATTVESLTGLGSVMDKSVQHANESLGSMDAALASMAQSGKADQAAQAFQQLTRDADAEGITVEQLKRAFPQYQDALAGAGRQTSATNTATKSLTQSTKELHDAAVKATEGILGSRDANRAYEQALDDAAKALHDNGRTLDIHTQKGRDNQAALDGIAKAADDAAQAILNAGGSQAQATAVLKRSEPALEAVAVKFGMSKKAAREFALAVLAIPKAPTVTPKVDTVAARAALDDLRSRLMHLNGVLTVTPSTGTFGQGLGVYRSPSAPGLGRAPKAPPGLSRGKVSSKGFVDMTDASSGMDQEGDIRAQIGDLQQQMTQAQAAQDQARAAQDQVDAAQKSSGAILQERAAARDLAAALAAASDARKKNGQTLTDHTQKGRDNQAALDAIATAANNSAQAVLAAGGSTAQVAAILKKAEPSLESMAVKFGMNRSAAHRYAQEVLAIPKKVTTQVTLDMSKAQADLEFLISMLDQVMQRKADAAQARAAMAAQAAANRQQAADMAAWEQATSDQSAPNVTVYATSQADPVQIGREVAWGVKVAS